MMNIGSACTISIAVVLTVYVGHAAGAGLSIMEQSVKGLGNAFAGGAAAAEDATTIFFNPAGLTRLTGTQATLGMHVLLPSAEFSNQGSTHLTGQPLRGGNGGNAGSTMPIPSLYFSHRATDRLSFGLGLYSPFGLSTEYDAGWVGRYHALKSELSSLDIAPTLAYRITDRLSLGAGIRAEYLKGELSNAIDFGTIFAALGAAGAAPQMNDGAVTFKGDNWSWGYNLGLLYAIDNDTRMGLTYRSRVEHTLSGDAHFSGVPSPNPTGRFIDSAIKADLTLPDSLSLSIWHNFSREWAAMADITWTHWSTIDELRIRFANPAESDAVITVRWKDAYRFALGATYTPGPWSFRSGVAYDQSPVQDASLSTPRVPDSDRVWLATGIGYHFNEKFALDIGYAHLFFVEDTTIRKSATGEDRLRGALSGTYGNSVDIISSQISVQF